MIATDATILKEIKNGNIVILPLNPANIGTNSVDLTLSNELLVYENDLLDSRKPNATEKIIIPESGFILEKGRSYLASTNEWTETKNYVPIIEGKSSLARLFLAVHITAGFGDVGFKGNWTLELVPHKSIIVYPNMKICQICYHSITEQPLINYEQKNDAKYSNQTGVTASKNHENFKK